MLVERFRGSNHIDIIDTHRPEERRSSRRVSKDGPKQDRACVHPSRRAQERAPQDEVRKFELQLSDTIGFMESIH